ncbi:WD40-repeat-containing domain protein [Endogone sp. FLAS-F59071]|nr:WD40-repeat-containing domain protein [Endogone sp. FLAS-F59071]|eukprot:RUS18134.1 WD40-repeat-containing domain protein [Endogone sp. FLAS-F59071]
MMQPQQQQQPPSREAPPPPPNGTGQGPPQQQAAVNEYNLPGVLHYLQSEWRRFERERNEWEIERAEMKPKCNCRRTESSLPGAPLSHQTPTTNVSLPARFSTLRSPATQRAAHAMFLQSPPSYIGTLPPMLSDHAAHQGERRGIENSKMDLMRRVKMLEYALRQERKKYVSGLPAPISTEIMSTSNEPNAMDSPNAPSSPSNNTATLPTNQQPKPATWPLALGPAYSAVGDAKGRARSREVLKMWVDGYISSLLLLKRLFFNNFNNFIRALSSCRCLQEISYLTNTPTRIPTNTLTLSPFPNHHNNLTPLPPHIRASLMREREAAAAIVASQGNFSKANRNSTIFVGPNTQVANTITSPTSSSPSTASLAKTAASSAALLAAQAKTRIASSGPSPPSSSFSSSPQQPLPPTPSAATVTASEEDEIIDPLAAHDRRDPGGAADAPERALLQERERDAETEETVPENVDEVAMMQSARKKWKQQQKQHQQHQHQQQQQGKTGKKAEKGPGEEDGEEEGGEEEQLTRDVQSKYNLTEANVTKLMKNAGRGLKGERKSTTSPEPQLDELANLSLDEEIHKAESHSKEKHGSEHQPKMWRTKFTLRSHLDTVRSVAFHPTEMVIVSGSEDSTVRLWNLKSSLDRDGSVSKKGALQDIEPNITYRGHAHTVTSVAISADQSRAYSASLDSTIRVWKIPIDGRETYAAVDASLNFASYVGHTDAIWDIRLFPLPGASHLLASASADGTVKIWDTAASSSPLKSSWNYNGAEKATVQYVPTSLDFCPTDLKKLAVSYTNAIIKVFDVETGQVVATFKGDETYDNTPATQINRIVAHTAMSLVISGHEDRHIRFFDLNSGSCTFSMQAHLDGVTSLDVDPSGLTLVSGGHDSSIRLWDISSSARTCVQEFTGHRRKGDEGVLSVRYHQSLPWMISGGADGIVKVYQHGV